MHVDFILLHRIGLSVGISDYEGLKRYIRNINNHRIWNSACREIREKYNSIEIYYTHAGRIGETICQYILHQTIGVEEGTLKLLISYNDTRENHALLQILDRRIPTISSFNYDFYIYMLVKNRKMISFDNWPKQRISRAGHDMGRVAAMDTRKLLEMNADEICISRNLAKKHKIQSPYICVFSRDPAYLGELGGEFSHHNFRDSSILNFSMTAREFSRHNIQLVRMGARTDCVVEFDNCIDYANTFREELMDIYLLSHCKFFIGGNSGIDLIPRTVGVPVATINFAGGNGGFSFHPYREGNLFIIKKFYDKRNQRFLNMWEILTLWETANYNGKIYEDMEIELIENSEQEILDLAEEMNMQVDGKWEYTPEDKVLQARFSDILEKWYRVSKYKKSDIIQQRIGMQFLRDNQYLLD